MSTMKDVLDAEAAAAADVPLKDKASADSHSAATAADAAAAAAHTLLTTDDAALSAALTKVGPTVYSVTGEVFEADAASPTGFRHFKPNTDDTPLPA